MKPWLLRCCVSLACATTACTTTPAAPPAQPLGWIGGRSYPIAHAWVIPKDNRNERWEVVLASDLDFPDLEHVAAEPGPGPYGAHVELGGSAQSVDAIGGNPGLTLFSFQADRAQAERWARALGTEARARRDPGLTVAGRVEATSTVTRVSEPHVLRFTVTNRGRTPVAYDSAGSPTHVGYPPAFSVELTRDGTRVENHGRLPSIDVMSTMKVLAPGESDAFELDLADWVDIREPGAYRAEVLCTLDVSTSPERSREFYETAHLRWDQAVRARCDFRVE